jgi:hypothetical protein
MLVFLLLIQNTYNPRMPTPDSAAAFAKLAGARAHHNQMSLELRAAIPGRGGADEQRYRQLQALWEEAFRDFQIAADEFVAIVHQIEPPDFTKI